ECPSLYRQSDFMFLPTLLECFTATYPEAMCMDTPILTSDLPFARSICGSAAEYFNPLSPKDIGDKIFNLSHDTVKVEELIKMGRKQLLLFDNSKQRADKYLKIITS